MTSTLLIAVILAQTPPAPPPLPEPPRLPPAVATAKLENGTIRIAQIVPTPVLRRIMVTRNTPDGKTVEEPTTVTEIFPVIDLKSVPLAEAKASDLAGKPIAAEQLAERLKGETVVVLIRGLTLEERYRKVFRDDVVVLTIPPVRKGAK